MFHFDIVTAKKNTEKFSRLSFFNGMGSPWIHASLSACFAMLFFVSLYFNFLTCMHCMLLAICWITFVQVCWRSSNEWPFKWMLWGTSWSCDTTLIYCSLIVFIWFCEAHYDLFKELKFCNKNNITQVPHNMEISRFQQILVNVHWELCV